MAATTLHHRPRDRVRHPVGGEHVGANIASVSSKVMSISGAYVRRRHC
jgi:hypothetical protein